MAILLAIHGEDFRLAVGTMAIGERSVTEDGQRWRHELERQDQQRALDQARHDHDLLNEIRNQADKAAVESAHLVFRTAVLINGGAAVSMLAFVGGLISQNRLTFGPQLSAMTVPLVLFAFGVLAGALGIGCVYFVNFCATGHVQSFARQWEHPHFFETAASRRWRYAAILSRGLAIARGLAAAILFVCGVLEVRGAITQPAVHATTDGS
jgi:hypothetical protein